VPLTLARRGLLTRSRQPDGPSARPPARSLQDRFDLRRNHLTLIRLGLATVVAMVHALELGFGYQPAIGYTQVGNLAVDAFFVLSGFLITASYLRLKSVGRYLWHRFLRIMPGFWICLILTAVVVAPVLAVLQGRSAGSVFTTSRDSALDYLIANAALHIRQFGIAGLPEDVPVPGVLDGALWTLFYEAVCYVGVIALGAVGALHRRRALTLLVLAGVWLVVTADTLGFQVVGQDRMPRFALLFLLGTAAWLYAHRIPITPYRAAGALAVLVASLVLLPQYEPVGGAALAYLCLWLAVVRPPSNPPHRDLSYGLYIYHWPVQQLLVVAGLAAWGRPAFVTISVALALIAATASWRWVEKPALGWKDAAGLRRGHRAGAGGPSRR
jgi:peptidoglycan/LPS O-acetylase OafA/YrhL